MMKRTRSFVLAAFLLIWAARVVWQQRTARIVSATIVRVTGSPPTATIALACTRGPRPTCLIVDVQGEQGGGSTTIYGDHDTLPVVLTGPLGGRYTVTVAASSRVFGRLQTNTTTFTS